jgi:hypothetical protein
MVTDRFSVAVMAEDGVYNCKVVEIFEENETYYHLDIRSPRVKDVNNHVHRLVHHIEMRIDCDTKDLKIKVFNQIIPDELIKIEHQLSEAICKRQA